MNTRRLDGYFEKYKKLAPPDDIVRRAAQTAVGEHIGAAVEKKNIRFRSGTLFIKEKPAVKSEILLKKTLLLRNINEQCGKLLATDIR